MYRSASTMAPAFSGGRISRSMRSAKSVAWIRLNVVGVSIRFFLPREVVFFTSGEEFQWLLTTMYRSDSSHCRSNASWVVLPDPSMPSTMKSLPGCLCVPYISMRKLPLHRGGFCQIRFVRLMHIDLTRRDANDFKA